MLNSGMAKRLCRSVNSYNITVLLILLGAALLFYDWPATIRPHRSASPEGKVHVLLLSSWRSGSSFLGQVLSQHPSVFYLMEPAWHVWTSDATSGAAALRGAVRDLLWSLYKCDFSKMSSYLPGNPLLSDLFMWSQSRALCSPPACPVKSANWSHCELMCQNQTLNKAEESCRTHTHVVFKETRFFELESLYPLLQDPNLDLRVVHLVRDPRAVTRSREASAGLLDIDSNIVLEHRRVSEAERPYEVVREVCRSHMDIYDRGILNAPPFLEGRYKLVRYEDVVRNPITEVNDIYEFVGLRMTSEVEEWIHKMTGGVGDGGWTGAFRITSRNASEVSLAWRTVLQHDMVKRIQEVCKGAMWLLGYRMVHSEEQQNRLYVDLLAPMEL